MRSAPPTRYAEQPTKEHVRLLLVVDSLDVGGAERHVVDLAVALRRKGHEVTVACSVGGELSGPLQESNVPVLPLLDRLVKRRFSLAFARKLRRLIKEGGFSLVHAHVYASACAAAVATLGLGVPLVTTEHSEGSCRTRRTRQMNRWAYRRAKHIVAVSSQSADSCSKSTACLLSTSPWFRTPSLLSQTTLPASCRRFQTSGERGRWSA